MNSVNATEQKKDLDVQKGINIQIVETKDDPSITDNLNYKYQ